MKALVYRICETWQPNPEDCKPYDGVGFYDIFKPINTNIKKFEKELIQASENGGISGFTYEGTIELDDNEYQLYNGELMTEEDIAYEKWAEESGEVAYYAYLAENDGIPF